MKKIFSFILVLSLFSTVTQAQSGKAKTEAAQKKAAEERQRSVGGVRTENELKDDKGQVSPAKSSGEKNTGSDQQQNGDQTNPTGTAASSVSDTAAQASNTPAVIQSSTSESGSPSIMSENNGQGRDGTGNVQRAKPNIAGAEIPGDMNIDEKNTKKTGENPATSKIREEEEAPARIIDPGRQDAKKAVNEKEPSSKKADGKSTIKKNRSRKDKG